MTPEEYETAKSLYRLVQLGIVSETEGGYTIDVELEADAIAAAYPDTDVMLG